MTDRGPITIGVVGSRRRDELVDYLAVEKAIKGVWKEGDTFVSGGCARGGDHFVEVIACRLGARVKIYQADWGKYGKGAGIIRNTDIAHDADVLIACVSTDRTGGTEDTITKFKEMHPEGRLILV